MITFHSIVRGFEGEFDLIQRNAIRSWLRLDPQPEIILFGDEEHEPGAVQAAIDIGLLLYDVDRNDRGVPLVRSPIESVRPIRPGIRCLVNADIILFQSFVEATRRVAKVFDEFLIISRRYKLDFGRELGFEPGWDRRLLEEARLKGELGHGKAIDYFCYRGNFWGDVPDFAVGRTSWDNWLVWKALHEHVPVVDISNFSMCVHQNHYKKRNSEETKENRSLLKGNPVVGFADVPWQMDESGGLVELWT